MRIIRVIIRIITMIMIIVIVLGREASLNQRV